MANIFHRPAGPRAEYQEKQRQRVQKSPSLADEFPQLKSLTAKLEYHNSENPRNHNQLKYAVNLNNVKEALKKV
jgi:hypothetical protein